MQAIRTGSLWENVCASVRVSLYAQRAQDQPKYDANVWTIFRQNAQCVPWYANDDDDGDGDGDDDNDNNDYCYDNNYDAVVADDEPNERPKKEIT